jgi:hypothetical protein
MPKKTSSDKNARKLSCIKSKKLGIGQVVAQNHPHDPVMNVPKQEVTNGTGG